LSSGSPRRKALFAVICKEFEVCRPSEPKGMEKDGKAADVALNLAVFKAQWGALRNPGKKVVGADTLIEFERKIIGKPKSAKEAREILRALSGKNFAVFSGVCVSFFGGKGKIRKKAWVERAKVGFRKISETEISNYVKSKKWVGKAGGFNVGKMPACKWVREVKGDVNTVIGLPLERLKKEIK
ncbi:hypothetical protein COU37_03615, partial [Candidatus Micrarchaeota archaeon CG10_big_fil_rev_8_21_14_0_10_45_29]